MDYNQQGYNGQVVAPTYNYSPQLGNYNSYGQLPYPPTQRGSLMNKIRWQFSRFGADKLVSPMGLVIALQVVVIILLVVLINPKRKYDTYKQNQIIERAEELAKVDPQQKPVVAIVSDADKLRGDDPVQQSVYKDANDGDYVLAYTDTIIIYRKDEDRIIYSGDNPRTVLSKNQQELLKNLTDAVVKQKIVAESDTKNPQLLAVTDPGKLREQDAAFYALAKENDLIAYFPEAEKIVLYRPSDKKVLNSGSYRTQIIQS